MLKTRFQKYKHNINLGYVKSEENPADIGPRGETVNKLMNNELWWKWPKWMVLADDKWPVLTCSMMEEVHNNINKEVKGVIPIYEAILISQILLNPSPFNIREDKY